MKKYITFFCLFSLSLYGFVTALSQSLPAGLPEDISGYNNWTKINKKTIRPRFNDPHRGYKKVYVNQETSILRDSKTKKLLFPYPEGTIIVKAVRITPKANSNITLISIMRKKSGNETTGGWDFIEYTMSSSDNSFIPINFSKESCYACHQGASNSDSVWTKFDNFRK